MRFRGVRKGSVLLRSLLVPLLAAGVLISLLPAQGEAMGWRPAWPPWGPATGNLAVTVTSAATNSALNGAQVSVAGRSMTTDKAGQAVFSGLNVGQYPVNAAAAVHQPGVAQAAVNRGQTTSVGIRLAAIPPPPPPPPPPPVGKGALTVIVVGAPQNMPLANSQVRIEAQVVLRPKTPPQLITRTAPTGPNGQAQFQNLPPGQYRLTAMHSAYRQGSGAAVVGTAPARATLRLTAVSGPGGPAAKAGNLLVRVSSGPQNAPVADATVQITGTIPPSAPGRPAQTVSRAANAGSDGVTRFLNIPQGSYRVQATHKAHRPWTGTTRVGDGATTVLARLTPVAGPLGPTGASGNLTVVVTIDKGKPITNAQVSIQGTSKPTAMVSARQVTGKDGAARFQRIPQGGYRANVTAPGHQSGSALGNVGGNTTFRVVLRAGR